MQRIRCWAVPVFGLTAALLYGASFAQDAEEVPLIPRQVLFGNPDRAGVRISPDGMHLSFLAPLDGVLNLWVAPIDKPEEARPVTRDTGRGIQQYFWTYTNHHLVYIQDEAGEENWRVYSLDLNTGAVKDLTPLEGVAASVLEVSEKHPHELLVGLNDRNSEYHDVYRVNLETGERTLMVQNDSFAGFVTDRDFNVRYATRLLSDGSAEMLKPKGEGEWETAFIIPEEDIMTTGPLAFDKSGRFMYALDSRGRDTAALVVMDTETGESRVLAEDPQADVDGIILHPTEKTVRAATSTYDRTCWHVLEPEFGAHLHALRGLADGDIEITSKTLDDRLWVVAFIMDNGPVRYYLYDTRAREARFLFTNRKALEGLPLARMHPLIIRSHDDLNLVSYLTLPVASDPDEDGRPDRPVPLVLLVHGGPWSRDGWGYDALHQWLANRGYGVLSVNYRGSSGFGKAFINAGSLEWGRKMHWDLIDAVNWMIAWGIADPKRIAIAGGSYGGYATLVGLTFTPEVFACGVDIVGISNLITFLNSVPPYWQPAVEMFKRRVGDHTTEEGRAFLKSRSPLTYAHSIARPLLIGQGANDPRVKQAESDQIVQALQAKGLPVTYVLYPDEGHGFVRPENNLSFFAVMEAFLAQHLGGRYEPAGSDFVGSSITVPVGAEHVPGIAEALQRQAPAVQR